MTDPNQAEPTLNRTRRLLNRMVKKKNCTKAQKIVPLAICATESSRNYGENVSPTCYYQKKGKGAGHANTQWSSNYHIPPPKLDKNQQTKRDVRNIVASSYPCPCRRHRRTFQMSTQSSRSLTYALTAPTSDPNHLKKLWRN